MDGGLMSLVNSTEYKGYKIKEWSISQFARLTPCLSAIADEYGKKNIQFSDLSDILTATESEGTLGLSKAAMTMLSPMLSRSEDLLRISLGVTSAQLEELPFSDGIVLVLLIMKTNMSHLSNFFLSLVGDSSPATTA
jgi:hypothetical protein